MKLLALLIGIYAERYLARWSHLREFRPFEEQANRIAERLIRFDKRAAPYIIAGLTVLCAAPIAVVAWLLRDAWGQIPWFFFAVVVLVFSCGPRDLKAEALAYNEKAEAGDGEGAAAQAESILGASPPKKPEEQAAAVERATYLKANNRIFGVIFWFLVAGAAGAGVCVRLPRAEQPAPFHRHATRRRRTAPGFSEVARRGRVGSGPHYFRQLRAGRQFRRCGQRLAWHPRRSAAQPLRGVPAPC